MLTIVADAENSGKITIPVEELEKLGFNDGDEVEFALNEANEIILKSKEHERNERILKKTQEIIERRRSALIELGKGQQ